jgi:hypothetical protein
MKVSEIINLLDTAKLNALDKADKRNHKITGRYILKSFVSSILKGERMSLRTLETVTNNNKDISSLLKAKNIDNKHLDHSSIGKRLRTVDVGCVKEVYEDLVVQYNTSFSKEEVDKFQRFDSTMLTISGKLLKDGLNRGGPAKDRHIKVSVSLSKSIPSSVRFCKERSETSEEVALLRAINEAKVEQEDILLFDRGLSKGNTFKELTQEKREFITRANIDRKYLKVKNNKFNRKQENGITIISDQIIKLYNQQQKTIDCNLRLIKAKNRKETELWFLSNVFYLSAHEVCAAYKKRWDIEVFFKFIKQNLQFKHFISYNSNGIKVYLYCVLIAAILFVIFKSSNQLTGFKIPLLLFSLALQKEMIKHIVLFCGGDPNLVDLKLSGP